MISEHLKSIFAKSVQSVQTNILIKKSVSVERNNILNIEGNEYRLKRPCFLVGFGKAVWGMATELERILGRHLRGGIITVPQGSYEGASEYKGCSKIRVIEGATNNLPDLSVLKGAIEIKESVEQLTKDDFLIVLISGGGSALLPLPKPPITLEEKLWIIKELSLRGADIRELNTVRKKLSLLKGGGLINFAYPARIVSLILSDIVDDPIELIASGPTVINTDKQNDAYKIIEKYFSIKEIPNSVQTVLVKNDQFKNIPNVDNYIIGNNAIALAAAVQEARTSNYGSEMISRKVTGDVETLAKTYAQLTLQIVENKIDSTHLKTLNSCENALENITKLRRESKKICLIFGGEPTVTVRGQGKGGRNQHLVLQFFDELAKMYEGKDVFFLSAGTDGIDGPTDAAGAFGSCELIKNAREQQLDVAEFLKNNDSYHFFREFNAGTNLIRIGHTGTNVMDIHVLILIVQRAD